MAGAIRPFSLLFILTLAHRAQYSPRTNSPTFLLHPRRTPMRMLMKLWMPVEPFNTLVRNGTAGDKLQQILEDLKPEAAYFTAQDGHRGGIIVVNINDTSEIPRYAEPFFLTFNAEVQ